MSQRRETHAYRMLFLGAIAADAADTLALHVLRRALTMNSSHCTVSVQVHLVGYVLKHSGKCLVE